MIPHTLVMLGINIDLTRIIFIDNAYIIGNTRETRFRGLFIFSASFIFSTYVRFDIIRRILSEFFNYNVVSVMGMTDVDDKIIIKSNELGESCQSITNHFENEFFRDMDSLNVLRPLITCKVTNYIPEIIAFIKLIIDKNGAYVGRDGNDNIHLLLKHRYAQDLPAHISISNLLGSIYFDISKYANYGKLKPAQTKEFDSDKKSSLDFALWKASKKNEPFWESPWGPGRPGWHIECSAIAR
jgi:cysteinyl-tRNA synthetase